MSNRKIIPLKQPITTAVTLPGSLSYTVRALLLGAMTSGKVEIRNALKSDDTYAMFKALQTLGISSEETADGFIITGDYTDVTEGDYTIDINLSGRSARMILPFLCVLPGKKTLTCAEPFKKRPMKDLVDAMRTLGAEITYLEKEGSLPIEITSSKLMPQKISIPGHVSSQYFTALMLVAPIIGGITIEVEGKQASIPYIDTTIDILTTFGVTVNNNNYQSYEIDNQSTYRNPGTYVVETDASSASYFMGIAAVTGSTITIKNLPPDSKQGDVAFADLMGRMGCKIIKDREGKQIMIMGPTQLTAISADMNHTPDMVPTIATVAAFATGETKVTNVAHVKLKESDRLEVPKEGLTTLGIQVETTDDSITIAGGIAHGGEIKTHHDHRIAMAFAVAGAKIEGIIIKDADVVAKSFPNFWDKLNEIGIESEVIE